MTVLRLHRTAAICLFSLSLLCTSAFPSSAVANESLWDWPAAGALLRTPALPNGHYGAGHRGLDIAAAAGREVLSPMTATVTWVGKIAGRQGVTVTAGSFKHTLMNVAATVARGEDVLRGEPIGTSVISDHCSKTCIHWGVRERGNYIDPRIGTKPRIVRLSPR